MNHPAHILSSDILLSICIPAYNRPQWLRRALRSIVTQVGEHAHDVEIVVSDDSTTQKCRRAFDRVLSGYRGKSTYVRNAPRLGMAENWNNAVRLSTGRYVQVLHDDDFLAKGKLGDVVSNLRDDDLAGAVNLFGVRVVNQSEEVVRRQTFRRYRYLTPENALRSVLSDSAFVRFPGMVIRRDVFDTLGYFRPELGYPADTEMWARLVSRHGLACHPVTIANFTVHQNALTMKMFNAGVIETQDSIFQEIRSSCRMDDRHLEKVRSAFFNKFILGGACRYIRWRNLSQAKSTMRLFQEVTLRSLPVSWKWLPLRVILTALLLPLRASRPELHGVHAGE